MTAPPSPDPPKLREARSAPPFPPRNENGEKRTAASPLLPHVIIGLHAINGPAALQHGAGKNARSGAYIRQTGILPAALLRQKPNNGGGIIGPALGISPGFSSESVSIIH